MAAMLWLVVCSLYLSAPAQMHVIETIFEQGIEVNQNLSSSSRVLTIPAGLCNITLYPSNLVCTDQHPYPYWLQIKVVDIKMAETSVSQDLLEVRVVRRGLQRYSTTGECFAPATVSLAATCGEKILTSFDKWQYTPVQIFHGPRIESR